MFLPTQENALAVVQCLDIIEKTGRFPKKSDGPICQNAENWDARKIHYHLSEFVDIEELPFYENQPEQNNLIAEEGLRELVNQSDMLYEAYDILLNYSKEIPEPESYKVIIPKNETFNPQKVNPDYVPNLWQWSNVSAIFLSLQALLKDPKGKKLTETLETIEQTQGKCPYPSAIVICQLKRKPKNSNPNEFSIVEDAWYTLKEPHQNGTISWLTNNQMCIEQVVDILEQIRNPTAQNNQVWDLV